MKRRQRCKECGNLIAKASDHDPYCSKAEVWLR